MSYDPTQQVPPPQNYPPQNYPPPPPASQPPQAYPPPYTQQGYQPAPPTYPQYGTPPPPPGAGFDFNATWKKLGRSGQVCLISGIVLFVSFLLPWFSVSVSGTNSLGLNSSDSNSYNAFAVATNNGSSNVNGSSFFFSLVWLVIVASIAFIAIPIITAFGKFNARQGQMFTLITAGIAFLVEFAYMIQAFNIISSSDRDSFKALGIAVSVGPGFGFWLGLLATLAAGGVYLYFGYLKKPGAVGGYQAPYQQALPYPGSQPQYPGSQPQYPGSQPQYPGSQPQYQPPAQYPTPPPLPPTQYQPPPPQFPGQPQPPYPGQ